MERLDNETIAEIVDSEGIGYAITEYLSSSDIEDEYLSNLWQKAYDLLDTIESYLSLNS